MLVIKEQDAYTGAFLLLQAKELVKRALFPFRYYTRNTQTLYSTYQSTNTLVYGTQPHTTQHAFFSAKLHTESVAVTTNS